MEWSKEYCGLSHLGEFSIRKLWVTVERFDDCAKLLQWFPGCQFSPEESWHKTVDDAKKAGGLAMGIKPKSLPKAFSVGPGGRGGRSFATI